jgi:hypothetical protein
MVGLVTGASRGIGLAVARRLSAGGASLALVDLPPGPGEEVSDGFPAERTVAVGADVRRAEDLERAAARCLDAFGRIDFVVANAGTCDMGPFADGDPDLWRNVVETNLLGVAYTVRGVLPAMRERGEGHIVIMASVSGREIYTGQPMYMASKWGVVGLGYSLRREVAAAGIRVTLVEPGLVDTELAQATVPADSPLQEIEALTPDDVARVVAFAIEEPARVVLNEIVLRPRFQEL